MSGPCTTCARTGVCKLLPVERDSRLAFAQRDHDCHVPLALTAKERRATARLEDVLAEAKAWREAHENQD